MFPCMHHTRQTELPTQANVTKPETEGVRDPKHFGLVRRAENAVLCNPTVAAGRALYCHYMCKAFSESSSAEAWAITQTDAPHEWARVQSDGSRRARMQLLRGPT